jgi:hypothetical protein
MSRLSSCPDAKGGKNPPGQAFRKRDIEKVVKAHMKDQSENDTRPKRLKPAHFEQKLKGNKSKEEGGQDKSEFFKKEDIA